MEVVRMFGRKESDAAESRLDGVGSALLGASRASDDEVEAAISSPLLFSRIKAAISERERPDEPAGSWLGLLSAARFAVPAMALLALVAGSVPLFESSMAKKRNSAAYTETDPGVVSFAASACALSSTQECAVSSNEVLATIFAEETGEQPR
jgi:hypothetical protein